VAVSGATQARRYLSFLLSLRDNAWTRRFAVVLIALLLFLYPIVALNEAQLSVANTAEVYVLLALGLNIVVGFAGLLDLGYAAFFAIGAYTTALLGSTHFAVGTHTISNLLFTVGPGGIYINFFALIPVAACVAAFFGIVFGAPTLRLRGDYLAIVTLGFGEIVPRVVENLGQGNGLYLGRHGGIAVPNITGGINDVTGIESPPNINILWIHWTFQTNDQRPWYYLGFIIIAISVVLIVRLRDSRLGRSWVAIREDEVAASHAGINVTGARLTAFALGASFSGFGGLLYATRLGSVSYDQFLFAVSVTILVMVILGGMGSIPGVMLGGAIIAFLTQTWLDTLSIKLNDLGANLQHDWGPIGGFGGWLATAPFFTAKSLILGIILVAVMLLRPQGLWPERRRAREFHPETEQQVEEEHEELWSLRTGEI
jgi:branched-chain amino acid transport system permease protein